jgi:hypothetical protein
MRRERVTTTFLLRREVFASDVRSIEPLRLKCMIFMCFSVPITVVVLLRIRTGMTSDCLPKLITFCLICGWPRFLVWLTEVQGEYGRGSICATTPFDLRWGFLNVSSRSYFSRFSPSGFCASRLLHRTGRNARQPSGSR